MISDLNSESASMGKGPCALYSYVCVTTDVRLCVVAQLPERLGPDFPVQLCPHTAGRPEDPSEDHRHCGNALHL